jgi:two-component system cell cycle response regulator
MPGIDGFEVCRRIKAGSATTHLPVVMVTALDQPADRVAALEAGADEFLTKPFEPIAFMALVRSLIRRKMVVDELRLSGADPTRRGHRHRPRPARGHDLDRLGDDLGSRRHRRCAARPRGLGAPPGQEGRPQSRRRLRLRRGSG